MYTPYYFSSLWPRFYDFPVNSRQSLEWELTMLESYRDNLEYEIEEINQELEDVEARIEELAKLMEEGEEQTAPGFRASTLWNIYPFGTITSRKEETYMLESVEKDLSLQLERIKKRLTELGSGDNQ